MIPLDRRPSPDFIERHVTAGFDDPLLGGRAIDFQKVVEVALNPDDEMRNLQVALCYSLTSARMDRRLVYGMPDGETPRVNANWFSVAQWAVLTVGRNMRSSDLPHRTSDLPASLRRLLTPAILNTRAADDRRIATALSYGQVMVFASVYRALLKWSDFADGQPLEVGRGHFASAGEPDADPGEPPAEAPLPQADDAELETVPDGTDDGSVTVDAEALRRVIERADSFFESQQALAAQAAEREAQEDVARRRVVKGLASQLGADVSGIDPDAGQPSADFYRDVLDAIADRAGYEQELVWAFELYRRAAYTAPERRAGTEDRTRADLIFEATLRIAAVEQVILDAAVTMVVEQMPRHLVGQAEGRLATFVERSLRVPRRIAQVDASRRLNGLAEAAKEIWARVMTDQVMVVAFPSETVRLGKDIGFRDWQRPFYAEELQVLSPSAQALFDQFDRSLGDGRGAGAGDWRRFDDRLNFVANLLRSRQQDASILWQPFSEEDIDRVWNGQRPSRLSDPYEQAVRTPTVYESDLDTVSCDELAAGRGAYDPSLDKVGRTTA
jgi:hypothetical protein